MQESGFIDFILSQSKAPVTVSKTAILFVEENNDNPQITHLHCVGGITHVVDGLYTDIRDSLPKFVPSQSKSNEQPRVAIHDWNVSYIEKGSDDTAIVYFTEPGVSISLLDSYEDIIAKFHAL
ncbi:hypothetical protein DV589_04800 [Salmonella enterica]|nr:hypothetical protein [Salmonella enterica]EKF0972961.1 hypothetical protein [Salmonella enterica]